MINSQARHIQGPKFTPANTCFEDFVKFEAGTQFGRCCIFISPCEFGPNCTFEENCSFGMNCHFQESCQFRRNCVFGINCIFERNCRIEEYCTFPMNCIFGLGCTFREGCDFGSGCNFKGCNVFYHESNFYSNCKFGPQTMQFGSCTYARNCIFAQPIIYESKRQIEKYIKRRKEKKRGQRLDSEKDGVPSGEPSACVSVENERNGFQRRIRKEKRKKSRGNNQKHNNLKNNDRRVIIKEKKKNRMPSHKSHQKSIGGNVESFFCMEENFSHEEEIEKNLYNHNSDDYDSKEADIILEESHHHNHQHQQENHLLSFDDLEPKKQNKKNNFPSHDNKVKAKKRRRIVRKPQRKPDRSRKTQEIPKKNRQELRKNLIFNRDDDRGDMNEFIHKTHNHQNHHLNKKSFQQCKPKVNNNKYQFHQQQQQKKYFKRSISDSSKQQQQIRKFQLEQEEEEQKQDFQYSRFHNQKDVEIFHNQKDVEIQQIKEAVDRTNAMMMGSEDSIDDLPENMECVICLGEKKEYLCVPCGHLCLCKNCYEGIKTCPICNQAAAMIIKCYD